MYILCKQIYIVHCSMAMNFYTCVATVLWTSERWLILASSCCTSSNLCLSCCSCSSSAVCFCKYLWYTASWSLPNTQARYLPLFSWQIRFNHCITDCYIYFFLKRQTWEHKDENYCGTTMFHGDLYNISRSLLISSRPTGNYFPLLWQRGATTCIFHLIRGKWKPELAKALTELENLLTKFELRFAGYLEQTVWQYWKITPQRWNDSHKRTSGLLVKGKELWHPN